MSSNTQDVEKVEKHETNELNEPNKNDEQSDFVEYKEKILHILSEFLSDILTTFPEYNETLPISLVNILLYKGNEIDEYNDTEFETLTEHLRKSLSPLFFDIIQENSEIFDKTSDKYTELLPGIEFKDLWAQDISDKTKSVIFKYLQILLVQLSFTSSADANDFGDAQELFSAIPQEEFKTMMDTMLQNISEHFDSSNNNTDDDSETSNNFGTNMDSSNINLDDLPNAEQIHEHMNSMLGGKIGSIAREIAEEISKDFDLDGASDQTSGDVLKNLFKNPTKLMGMVKKIGTKLEEKMKDESMNKEELMSEAMDLMNNMKNMPGMPDMNSLLSSMGLGGHGAKMDFDQMSANMARAQEMNSMKAGMLKRLEERKRKRAEELKQKGETVGNTIENMENMVFTKGETPQRSSLHGHKSNKPSKSSKKKGGKKKKKGRK
jgi:hypothetical protein